MKASAGCMDPNISITLSFSHIVRSCRHLGHIGYTPEQGFSVQNNSPEWNGIFDQLKALGISADEINSNQDFIKDFVEQRGGPTAPSRTAGQISSPPPPTPMKQPNTAGKTTSAIGWALLTDSQL
jgi:hypothetical protein